MFFKNRINAGDKLAKKLDKYADQNVVVVAIPIGGLVIGCCIANKLNAALDISMATVKFDRSRPYNIVAAFDDEMEIVVDKNNYYENIHNEILESQEYLHSIYHHLADLNSRPDINNKIAIITDDGPITDNKILAAINLARRKKARKIIVAVPVIAPYLIKKIRTAADELFYLDAPRDFYNINNYYQDNKLPKIDELKEYIQDICKKRKRFKKKKV